MNRLAQMEKDISILRGKLGDANYSTGKLVTSSFKKAWRIIQQPTQHFGLYFAICVDTLDPLRQNRVRFFSPFMCEPGATLEELNWAYPISSMGGFDDSGLNWVPPAGSMLAILFERGHRSSAFYIGTTWSRDRGAFGESKFTVDTGGGGLKGPDMTEYYKIHNGHRKGYLVGANDESQVLPPWNTESYNAFDYDTTFDYEKDPNFLKNQTWPNIYGFKTPQKHMLKMVDGNSKCNHRWKRMELLSSCGGFMVFKDDNLHPAIQCTNPNTSTEGGSSSHQQYECNDDKGNPIEKPTCDTTTAPTNDQESPLNPYFKHANELRPYLGSMPDGQNNKVDLKQAGIQILSHSGHTFRMDDSVEEPNNIPDWEQSIEPFDFGCTDLYTGKTNWVSATGHIIEMSDKEKESRLRGDENYIRLRSALGNSIELNDDTVKEDLAGPKRGITLRSTSNHSIEMIDNENEQGPTDRKGADAGSSHQPTNRAKRAFVRIRTGYGLQISLNDCLPPNESGPGAIGSQEKTINQSIQIYCPQKDNADRGPHIMHFQEIPEGPGQVWLKVGGDYINTTYDNHVTVVGDKDKNPTNKITLVSQHTVISSEKYYYNAAETHAFLAKKIILLMAGKDCTPKTGNECQPCVWPVLCFTPKGIVYSDRVYASASPDATCASIYHMKPYAPCKPWQKCTLTGDEGGASFDPTGDVPALEAAAGEGV